MFSLNAYKNGNSGNVMIKWKVETCIENSYMPLLKKIKSHRGMRFGNFPIHTQKVCDYLSTLNEGGGWIGQETASIVMSILMGKRPRALLKYAMKGELQIWGQDLRHILAYPKIPNFDILLENVHECMIDVYTYRTAIRRSTDSLEIVQKLFAIKRTFSDQQTIDCIWYGNTQVLDFVLKIHGTKSWESNAEIDMRAFEFINACSAGSDKLTIETVQRLHSAYGKQLGKISRVLIDTIPDISKGVRQELYLFV